MSKTYQVESDICRRCGEVITDRSAKKFNPIWYCKRCKKIRTEESVNKTYRRSHPRPKFKTELIISALKHEPTSIEDLLKITGIKSERTLKTLISFLRRRGYKIRNHKVQLSYYVMSNEVEP